MSVDTFVFLRGSDLPTVSRWQAALDELGIDLRLDPNVDPTVHSGYWPTALGGEVSGFECYWGPVADVFGKEPPSGLGPRDSVVNFVTHSDMRELVRAMYAASALASASDALILDGEAMLLVVPDALVAQARAIEADEL